MIGDERMKLKLKQGLKQNLVKTTRARNFTFHHVLWRDHATIDFEVNSSDWHLEVDPILESVQWSTELPSSTIPTNSSATNHISYQ